MDAERILESAAAAGSCTLAEQAVRLAQIAYEIAVDATSCHGTICQGGCPSEQQPILQADVMEKATSLLARLRDAGHEDTLVEPTP
jgi:hypothetical protein